MLPSSLITYVVVTIGDPRRRWRLDKGLTLNNVAKLIDINELSLKNGEVGRRQVSPRYRRCVDGLVGFCPYDSSLILLRRTKER